MQKRFYSYKRFLQMRKIILLSIFTLAFFCSSWSETVSQKETAQLAQLFFNEANGRVVAPPKLVYNGRKLTTSRLFTPFYVYNNMLGGFVIVSAENKAFPILGFSLKDSFDPNVLGEAELALLRSYAREIELIRYDSSPVFEAENSWINYPEYVAGILSASYMATDPKLTISEADKIVEGAEIKDDAVYSDLYTPLQWQEMIEDELKLKESVPLVLVEGDKSYPAVVYGRQGNYFRLEMSTRNNWLMRLNATEVISSNMISAVVNPLSLPLEVEEDLPFEDFDEFVLEVSELETNRTNRSWIDVIETDASPRIKPLGSGHYEVSLPEEAAMATVYNLGGAIVSRSTFGDSSVINIDISPEPRGFYFLTVLGSSGQPYGFKLVR